MNNILPERDWRVAVSGKHSAFAWALTACLGATSISLAPTQTLTRLLLPVAIMVVYVWVTYPRGLSSGLTGARIAQLADSVYFLGFLWTLWALIDSFVLKAARGTATPETAFTVFGYALVTTATGMALRLWLLHFKYTPSDQAAEAQFSVERSLQNFSSAAQGATDSIRTLQSNTEEFNRHMKESSQELENIKRLFVETHQETTQAISASVTATVEEIRATLKSPVQEYGRAIRAFTTNVNQQSQTLGDAVGQCSAKLIEVMSAGTERMRNIVDVAASQIASNQLALTDKLRAPITEVLNEFTKMRDAVGILQELNRSLAELQPTIAHFNQIMSSNGPLRSSLGQLASDIRSSGETATKAIADFVEKLDAVDVPEKLVLDISEVTQSIEHLQLAVNSLLVQASDGRWNRLAENTSQAALKLDKAAESLQEAVIESQKTEDGRGSSRSIFNLFRRS